MKKIKLWVQLMWRPILIGLGVALVVTSFYGFKLGSLLPGASQPEVAYITSIRSGKAIVENPVLGMHKVPVYALFKLGVNNIAAYRAVSAFFAALSVMGCFFVLREWYTMRVAVLGTWLYMTSAWILHIGRLATPEATFLLIAPFVWAVMWVYFTTLHKSALAVLSIFTALCFYIPGFIWLLLFVTIWQHKRIWREIQQVPAWFRIICCLIMIVLLVPLVRAVFMHPQVGLDILGLPHQLPNLHTLLHNLVYVPASFIIAAPYDPVRWLGRLPLLDIFCLVMAVFGAYSLRFRLKEVRSLIILGGGLILFVLVVLGAVPVTVLFLPIFALIADGIAFMLQQWFAVFPKNPFARVTATTAISLAVLFVSFYHINHYFIAWPQNPATRGTYSYQLPPNPNKSL